ncbi:MAG: tetratricopeptide repeat protein [Desulfobacterales bacterium]|nr:tetratricopeptide repeat protein [Desulfobacterales bacterium]
MIKKIFICAILCLLIATGSALSAKGEFCDLAEDILKKAATTFKTDKEQGIKLFLKAEEMCDTAKIKYNLGVVFYRYGNLDQAQMYLQQAVDKDGAKNAIWLNNLASVMLENNFDIRKTLETSQKAYNIDKNIFQTHDTLARAQFRAGNHIDALKTIHNAAIKWKNEKEIQKTRQSLFNRYTANCLTKIKNNNVDAGLLSLKKADFDEQVAITYCKVLSRLGKNDTALTAVMKYQKEFKNYSEFKSLKQIVMSTQIQQFYLAFKNGKDAVAVQRAKAFSEKYPDNMEAKKAYDELFTALIDDTIFRYRKVS